MSDETSLRAIALEAALKLNANESTSAERLIESARKMFDFLNGDQPVKDAPKLAA